MVLRFPLALWTTQHPVALKDLYGPRPFGESSAHHGPRDRLYRAGRTLRI